MGEIVGVLALGFIGWFFVLPVIGSFCNGPDHFCRFWGDVFESLVMRLILGGIIFGIGTILQVLF